MSWGNVRFRLRWGIIPTISFGNAKLDFSKPQNSQYTPAAF